MMQSPPYESQMSQDLLEDSEFLETAGHPMEITQLSKSQVKHDLLNESQMTEADGVPPDLLHESQYAANASHDDLINET